ncbi:hypothetical protein PW683_35580 [Streptomyces niveus]
MFGLVLGTPADRESPNQVPDEQGDSEEDHVGQGGQQEVGPGALVGRHRRRAATAAGPQRQHGEVETEQHGHRVVEGRPGREQGLGPARHPVAGTHGGHGERVDPGDRDTEHDGFRTPDHEDHHGGDQRRFEQHSQGDGHHHRAQVLPHVGGLEFMRAAVETDRQQRSGGEGVEGQVGRIPRPGQQTDGETGEQRADRRQRRAPRRRLGRPAA